MKLEVFTIPPLMENCYILHNNRDALIFDPGGDFNIIRKFLDDSKLTVVAILLTHGHFDHIGAAAGLQEYTYAPVYAHPGDDDYIKNCAEHAVYFGAPSCRAPKVDKHIKDGDKIIFNCAEVKVLHTPGHSLGSVCYYIENEGLLISGDTLFCDSVGRTDLPGGDFETLAVSIREKIYRLPPKTLVYPGHGFGTTIGHEKEFNPLVKS